MERRESQSEILKLLDLWASLPPGRERDRVHFDITFRFKRNDAALAKKMRELYLQTPETNRDLREFLFGLWVASPSQSEHVMVIASATDDPDILRSLGGILLFNEEMEKGKLIIEGAQAGKLEHGHEDRPGGIALLGRRLQESPRRELTEAILDALGRSPSDEASRLLRDWASAHPEEPKLRLKIAQGLHGADDEDAKYLTALLTSPQEQKDIQIAAVKSLGRNMLSEEPLLQRFLSVGLDPGLPDDLRLQAARTLTHAMAWASEPEAPILTLAKRSMEDVVSRDSSHEVRDAARRAALEVWRKEWLARALVEERERPHEGCSEEELKRRFEEIDRISQALRERRRRKEITREESNAEFDRQTAHLRDPAADAEEAQKQREEMDYIRTLEDLHPEAQGTDRKPWWELDEDP